MHAKFTTDYERKKTEIYIRIAPLFLFVKDTRACPLLLYPFRRKRVANIVKTEAR